MVSFQAPFFHLNQPNTNSEAETNSKKRKWPDDIQDQPEQILPYKQYKNPKSFYDIELHLETPLPSEWQRCLDMQSGEIHFYNTRTHKRTLRDPRRIIPEPRISPSHCHMSLDLELNLPCGSLNNSNNSSSSTLEKTSPTKIKKPRSSPPSPASSTDLFISLQGTVRTKVKGDKEEADDAAEMVATACMRCHMLVMLCKSSPTCPNCKFMHPPCQSSSDLFNKPRLSLSC